MDITLSPETLSRMDTAFQQYRKCMIASNRAFLWDIITVIKGRNLRPKQAQKKLINAVPSVSDPDWMQSESLQEVIEKIPDEDLDGVYLPPITPEKREEFFILLSKKVNDYI